ncbi:MAG TPA: phosphatase PAP2 family protein [Chlorobiota bacterium]|nr:phosphatase PAP2 family protein [Chlorobiota bacterium]
MTVSTALRSCVIVVLAAVCSYVWIDVPLAIWIHSISTPWMQNIGSVLEEAGKSHWLLGYTLIVVVVTWRSWRDVSTRHLVVFASIAASGILANIIKILINRSRPPLLFSDGIAEARPFSFIFDYIWQSFPSGHATTGLALAVAGSAMYPRYKILFWFAGLAIAAGRIIYNVHYLSDVLVGSALGIICAAIAVRMRMDWGGRWGGRWG